MPTRAPFVIAAFVAAVPLLVLAAAAPGGGDWRWLELPRHMTLLAIATGVAAMFHRRRSFVLIVPFVVTGIAFGWEAVSGTDSRFLVQEVLERVAPWLMGGLYAVLAYLAIARSSDLRANVRRAGAWLVAVGAIAAVFTLSNESWLTLENLRSTHGTFRSSVAWPDSKQVSIAADAVCAAIGVAAVAWSLRRPPAIPAARVHRGRSS